MVGGGIGSGALLGNLMALFAVAGFAGFAVALRRGRHTDMLTLACLAGVFTAVVAALMADSFAMTAYDIGLCVVMGVVQMSAGMVLFTSGSRHVPAAELALLLLTEVVLAPIWVWLWIGEVPRLWTLVGGAVIFAAIIGHAISGMRRKPPPFGAV
jgi:drug/metabolite transporter (DMT)-like permease